MSHYEAIKQKVKLFDVVSNDLQLKRSGKVWKTQCPFHDDNTPSFTVYPNEQTFHCFGCGENGTVIDYVMKRENFVHPTLAIEFLARKHQVKLEGFDKESWKERKRIVSENTNRKENARKQYSKVTDYLKSRGLTPETVKEFGLGYENGSLYIPFHDVYGEVVGSTLRNFEEGKPKYVNSPETAAFKKSELLYGLEKARHHMKKSVFVVEGYFDVMAMHELGIKNTVAYCGSALTDGQAYLLSKYITKETKIYLIPDNDNAGKKAIQKNIVTLQARLRNPIGIIQLPNDCKDANDYLVKGYKVENLKSEHSEKVLLKIELDKCLDQVDEYEIAQRMISPIKNVVLKAEIAEYLAERWKTPVEIVKQHINSTESKIDYLSDLNLFSTSLNEYREEAEKGDEGKIFTGYKDIDSYLVGGMKPTEVVFLYGRSGAGKTTFANNLIYNFIMQQEKRVLFHSLEVSRKHIVPQFVQRHNGLTKNQAERLIVSGEADDRLIQLITTMDEQIRIIDRPGQSIEDIDTYISSANKVVFDKPVDIVVIDYFQYLRMKGANTYDKTSAAAKELKELAKRQNVLVIALTQVNRSEGKDGSEKLSLQSARDSGAIEESGDYVFGLYRPAANAKLTEEERQAVQNEMYCQILKNRWGVIGESELYFEGMTKTIKDKGK